MVVNIKAADLEDAIKEKLELYEGNLTKIVNEKLEEVAQETAQELKKGGSYEERTGKYSKDWGYKAKKNFIPGMLSEEYSVYNKKHYQLTHLLEKGHISRAGKRVKAFEHIGPEEEMAKQKAITKINEAVRETN